MSHSPAPALRPVPRESAGRNALFSAVIFLGAFLLFQVQFLIAKHILPWFGGASAIWITSLFFFQVLLLGGYLYSHLSGKLAPRDRARFHTCLLLLSLVMMGVCAFRWPSPITPSSPVGSVFAPTTGVLATLLISVGLPFWLLSTSPLLQDWYATFGSKPYRMYALSNAGSLLGLLSYPFAVEPHLSIRQQAWIWCFAYTLFAIGSILCARMESPAATRSGDAPDRKSTRAATDVVYWLLLPAATSALLLGATNFITQDVAAVPLLWVVPLALYLLSFIVAFAREWAAPRWLLWPCFAISLAVACDGFYRRGHMALRSELAYHGVAVFFACLCAHAELARLKPSRERLTQFYLSIAGGSCLGSLLVALVVPHVFPEVWEYHVALMAIALLGIFAVLRDTASWTRSAAPWKVTLGAVMFGFGPLLLLMSDLRFALPQLWYIVCGGCGALLALTIVLLWGAWNNRWTRRAASISLFVPLLVLALLISVPMRVVPGFLLMRSRNFYGVIKVVELDRSKPDMDAYALYHGRILHGLQMRKPELRRRATTYYSNMSGGGLALRYHARRWNPDPAQQTIRFGLIGMGTATLLTYGLPGDYARVYELNPAIVDLSRGSDPYFTYLRDSYAKTDVVVGDARISLQAEADRGELQRFDVLLLDAFSGDAIPTHLLTRQAMQLYLRHLRDTDSLIAVHISNNFVDLEPIVTRLAEDLNLEGMIVKAKRRGLYVNQSEWVLLSPGNSPLRTPPLDKDTFELDSLGASGPLWTDDFSNLFSVLRRQFSAPATPSPRP